LGVCGARPVTRGVGGAAQTTRVTTPNRVDPSPVGARGADAAVDGKRRAGRDDDACYASIRPAPGAARRSPTLLFSGGPAPPRDHNTEPGRISRRASRRRALRALRHRRRMRRQRTARSGRSRVVVLCSRTRVLSRRMRRCMTQPRGHSTEPLAPPPPPPADAATLVARCWRLRRLRRLRLQRMPGVFRSCCGGAGRRTAQSQLRTASFPCQTGGRECCSGREAAPPRGGRRRWRTLPPCARSRPPLASFGIANLRRCDH
jgi:hypothetical protein